MNQKRIKKRTESYERVRSYYQNRTVDQIIVPMIGCKFLNSFYFLWNCDWIKVRDWQPSCSVRAIYRENWTVRTLFEQRSLNELCTSVTKEGVPRGEGWWSRLMSGMRKISQLMLPTQKIYFESANQFTNGRLKPNFIMAGKKKKDKNAENCKRKWGGEERNCSVKQTLLASKFI